MLFAEIARKAIAFENVLEHPRVVNVYCERLGVDIAFGASVPRA